MLLNFLDELRAAGIPASVKEHLVLLDALEREAIDRTPESFYYLARATYVKDEGLIDRFDQVFSKVFKGIFSEVPGNVAGDIPRTGCARSPRNSSRPKKWRRSSRWETGTRSWRR
jgi:uncharacterized protein with von Willebrand factor type A (vWA) domain